jgi:pyruvate dehydrogenase E1 component
MPPMPSGVESGILKGLYKFRSGPSGMKYKAQIFGSGPILRQAASAQYLLAERYDVSADVWSVTNYKQLRTEALSVKRWNMLHPTEPPRRSYLEATLAEVPGPFIAVSDYMKMVPDQIAPWVPGGLTTLGTDGFGRSDTRENLRRFFEIDPPMITVATLYAMAQKGAVDKRAVVRAMKDLNVDPEKAHPVCV